MEGEVGEVDKNVRTVLAALRRPRGERQLTDAIAAFAILDSRFSASIARVLVEAVDPTRATSLGEVPAELRCSSEVGLRDGDGREIGSVDLVFEDSAGDFVLLVEAKLHSEYGSEQVERYLTALPTLGAERSALMAVTRNPPRQGEIVAYADPRWLGSVRWARVFAGLRELTLGEESLDLMWRGLLDVVREQGDFGTVDLDVDAVCAWARYDEGRAALIGLLDELAPRLLDVVREEIGRAHPEWASDEAAALILRGQQVVWPWKGAVHVELAVPAAARSERLRVQFLAAEGRPHFTVEARYPDTRPLLGAEEVRDVTSKLGRADPPFQQWHSWGSYWARVHPADAWLESGAEIHDVLLRTIRADVRALAESGIFAALPLEAGEPSEGQALADPNADN